MNINRKMAVSYNTATNKVTIHYNKVEFKYLVSISFDLNNKEEAKFIIDKLEQIEDEILITEDFIKEATYFIKEATRTLDNKDIVCICQICRREKRCLNSTHNYGRKAKLTK